MSRHAIPWNVRAVERQMEAVALTEQLERQQRAVDNLVDAALADVAAANRKLEAANRIGVIEHQSITKLTSELRIVTGILDRAGIAHVQVSA